MAMSSQEKKAAQRSRPDGYAKSREADWRKRGITNATYQKYLDMLVQQNNQCAICGTHINGNSHLDHNHQTGKIRGLLCPICNMALGNLEPYLNQVQAYLQLADDMSDMNQEEEDDIEIIDWQVPTNPVDYSFVDYKGEGGPCGCDICIALRNGDAW